MIFGYCRVSSDEQAAHGISIDAQRDILRGYAAMSQSDIELFEDAGFSGKNTDRPALRRLLSSIGPDVSAVVVWKLDRLSRSLRDTLTMIEDVFAPAGVTLVSVTESIDTSTPSGRMMLNLLASFAQLEREQDSDRVVMAHKHLARDCKYLGGHVPLGYVIDENKYYQLHPQLAPVVRRIFDMYLAREGYGPMLSLLNSPAVLPLTGKRREFTKQDLYFLLQNETDPVIWRGPVIAGAVKQFWTDVVWNDVDFMFVDMPPGTGDVPLTVFQSLPVDGIIVVATPQELVGMIVDKAINMAKMMNVPVLGIVENMSYMECPHCGEPIYIFGESKLDAYAASRGLDVLGRIPMNPDFAAKCDAGKAEDIEVDCLDSLVYVLDAMN